MTKFIDIESENRQVRAKVFKRWESIVSSGGFILSKEVSEFENRFAKYLGAGYCYGVNSGTDALYCALLALGIGPGDEVLLPDFTFVATATAVLQAGAVPVFVDISRDTLNIDTDDLQKKITKRTRAVITVHLFGHLCDMKAVLAIAKRHRLFVVEDAAQAHGARWIAEGKCRFAGAIGDIGCFSFYPTKNLSCWGDGGAVVTNNARLASEIASIRDHGRKKERYFHERFGINSRLDALQAAVLNEKLGSLDIYNKKRKNIAEIYRRALDEYVEIPQALPCSDSVYHAFPILTPNRDRIISKFKREDIGYAVYYPLPLHKQKVFKNIAKGRSANRVSTWAAKRVVCLPVHPFLKRAEIEKIISIVKRYG